jgi:hypothetical protein|tara:strand:- start:352 stop:486 length:135 start_codon:yes stop_codon:yes gene_type:complete
MNRLGVQLKKFFEETPLPEGQESWGAWRDAEDKAEEGELGVQDE